jgi:lipid A 4'-phosphatase
VKGISPRHAAGMLLVLAALLIFVPAVDLGISGLFYSAGGGFAWDGAPVAEALHGAVQVVSRGLAVLLLLGLLAAAVSARRILGLDARRWLYLVLSLALGPGLVVNTILKDEWGRARPRQIERFGGTADFSPPLVLSDQCDRNCSFVAGDPAPGFWLVGTALVAPPRRRRALFRTGLALGLGLGLLRIGMGAHFLSDVLFSGAVVLAVSAGLYELVVRHPPLRDAMRSLA